MIVVSDTSPITNLMRIERIELLRELYSTVIIPSGVYEEIGFIEDQKRRIDRLNWIQVVSATDVSLLDELLERLDRGEAEAITLARELNAELLLIDETDGRAEARRLNIRITDVLGILIRAKELGLISLVGPEIKKIVNDAEFWIDRQLIQDVLVLVGEN